MFDHEKLLLERRRAKLNQTELAEKAGVSRQWISSLESGRTDPSASVLARLAAVLNVSADWLLGLSDTKERR